MINPYLAGVLFGDGTFHRGKNRAYGVWIDQHEKNIDIIDEIEKQFKNLKFKIHRYSFLNKIRVLTYSKNLYFWFKKLRQDPYDYFEELSNEEKFEFIGGLFDAGGTYTDRFVIYNANEIFLERIREFFITFGMKAYVYKFGKIYGVQICQKEDISFLKKQIFSIKFNRVTPSS